MVPGIELGTLLGQYTRGRARTYGIEAILRAQRGPLAGMADVRCRAIREPDAGFERQGVSSDAF